MELKFTAMTAQVTIESLVHLLKNSDINFDSIKVVVGNTKGGYQSPEIPLEKLVNIALGDMHEIISTDQQLDSLNLKSGEQTFKYGCRDLLLRSLHSSKNSQNLTKLGSCEKYARCGTYCINSYL